MALNHETFLADLNWRYATKQFDATKKIKQEDWHLLAESLRLSPSSYGLQPWQFLVVRNPELRAKLREVSWNQGQVTDSSHYVVFTTLKKVEERHVDEYLKDIATTRGLDLNSLQGYRQMMLGDFVNGPRAQIAQNWTQRQAYIAMGNLINTAAQLRIDSCPMEGLDPNAYDQILGLEDSDYSTVATVALGYRHADDSYANLKKVRYATERVIKYID